MDARGVVVWFVCVVMLPMRKMMKPYLSYAGFHYFLVRRQHQVYQVAIPQSNLQRAAMGSGALPLLGIPALPENLPFSPPQPLHFVATTTMDHRLLTSCFPDRPISMNQSSWCLQKVLFCLLRLDKKLVHGNALMGSCFWYNYIINAIN